MRFGRDLKGSVRVVLDSNKTLKGNIIIGADGCESTIGRKAHITSTIPLYEAFSSLQYTLKSTFCNDGFLHFFNEVKRDNLRFNLDTANQFVCKEINII